MQKQTNDFYLEAINRAIEFIESNASKGIALEDISAYSLISKYHFHRIFKSIIGDTTKAYLTRLRLEKSAIMLQNTDKAISEIAYDCGYGSPEAFTRAFKNYFATTPTLFKQSLKQALLFKQNRYKDSTLESMDMSNPRIMEIKDLNLAYIRHYGSYEKVGQSFQKLMTWATKNLVLKLIPSTLGIVHDNPDLTDEPHIRYDACIQVRKEIIPQGAIGFKKIKGGKFAVFRYQGPYDTFYSIYDYIYHVCLYNYKWTLRDQPAMEWYIKSPPFYKPKNYVTDFYLPIS